MKNSKYPKQQPKQAYKNGVIEKIRLINNPKKIRLYVMELGSIRCLRSIMARTINVQDRMLIKISSFEKIMNRANQTRVNPVNTSINRYSNGIADLQLKHFPLSIK